MSLWMNKGIGWGTLLVAEDEMMAASNKEEVEKKAIAEDIATKERLRLYMLSKNKLENVDKKSGKLAKKINRPCRYATDPDGCWPHADGLCPFMHDGEKYNFGGKYMINLLVEEKVKKEKNW